MEPQGEGRSPQKHYDTMDVPALLRWKPHIDALLARHAAVCWWVYGPRLGNSLDVLRG